MRLVQAREEGRELVVEAVEVLNRRSSAGSTWALAMGRLRDVGRTASAARRARAPAAEPDITAYVAGFTVQKPRRQGGAMAFKGAASVSERASPGRAILTVAALSESSPRVASLSRRSPPPGPKPSRDAAAAAGWRRARAAASCAAATSR